MFLIAQVCDGIFTYAGIHAYGLAAEGNLLLSTWMGLVGPGPAIVGAKLLAGGLGVLLYCLGVSRVLLALTLLYGMVAVGPWLFVLHHA